MAKGRPAAKIEIKKSEHKKNLSKIESQRKKIEKLTKANKDLKKKSKAKANTEKQSKAKQVLKKVVVEPAQKVVNGAKKFVDSAAEKLNSLVTGSTNKTRDANLSFKDMNNKNMEAITEATAKQVEKQVSGGDKSQYDHMISENTARIDTLTKELSNPQLNDIQKNKIQKQIDRLIKDNKHLRNSMRKNFKIARKSLNVHATIEGAKALNRIGATGGAIAIGQQYISNQKDTDDQFNMGLDRLAQILRE